MKSREHNTGLSLTLTGDGKTWVWVAVLLGALGWYKSVGLILLTSYFMLGLLVVNGILAVRQTRRLVITSTDCPPCFAREETTIRVEVANVSSQPATGIVEFSGIIGFRQLVHRVPGGTTIDCSSRGAVARRGRYASEPIRVVSEFPFGLARSSCITRCRFSLIVLPTIAPTDPEGMRRWLLQLGGKGRARKLLRRVSSDQADVRGVRPYRPGDAIRSIHWRSTARRRELMVREYDAAPALELLLVVEPWLPEAPTPEQIEELEAALSLSATIAVTWSRTQAARVTIVVAGDADSPRTAEPNEVSLREALVPLAEVVGKPEFPVLTPQTFQRTLHQVVCLLVSSRRNSPYADQLATSTGHLFGIVSPADTIPWYYPPTHSGDQSSR